eukprot:6196090-Pleurochrysis_carterae.AAC.1
MSRIGWSMILCCEVSWWLRFKKTLKPDLTIFSLALRRHLSTKEEGLTGMSSDCIGLGRLWGSE